MTAAHPDYELFICPPPRDPDVLPAYVREGLAQLALVPEGYVPPGDGTPAIGVGGEGSPPPGAFRSELSTHDEARYRAIFRWVSFHRLRRSIGGGFSLADCASREEVERRMLEAERECKEELERRIIYAGEGLPARGVALLEYRLEILVRAAPENGEPVSVSRVHEPSLSTEAPAWLREKYPEVAGIVGMMQRVVRERPELVSEYVARVREVRRRHGRHPGHGLLVDETGEPVDRLTMEENVYAARHGEGSPDQPASDELELLGVHASPSKRAEQRRKVLGETLGEPEPDEPAWSIEGGAERLMGGTWRNNGPKRAVKVIDRNGERYTGLKGDVAAIREELTRDGDDIETHKRTMARGRPSPERQRARDRLGAKVRELVRMGAYLTAIADAIGVSREAIGKLVSS